MIVRANRCFWIAYRFHSRMTSLLVPSHAVRGMTRLDRTAFTTTVHLSFLKLRAVRLSKLIPIVKKYLFKTRNFKSVRRSDDQAVIYLNPLLIKTYGDFLKSEREGLSEAYQQFGVDEVTLTYDNWQPHDILRAILPEEIEVPTSYCTIGHIVHMNLRDQHLPYKFVIGEVYLDAIPTAKTVVNKLNAIDTTFRNFSMEILAGETDTISTVKENGFNYEMDFAKVYWNSRLGNEHGALVGVMKPKDVLYDVFAGIGPFAIPAARNGVKVFANDLNPESYKWLKRNVELNKIKGDIECFNLDGREFISTVLKQDILRRRANEKINGENGRKIGTETIMESVTEKDTKTAMENDRKIVAEASMEKDRKTGMESSRKMITEAGTEIGTETVAKAEKDIEADTKLVTEASTETGNKTVMEKDTKAATQNGRKFVTEAGIRAANKAVTEIGTEHVVMNLPALAVEFLDAFIDSFDENEIKEMCRRPPIVHLYCFAKTGIGKDACELGKELVERKLGCELTSDCLVDLRNVRNVSLGKDMIRVSFRLKESVLRGAGWEEPARKKSKVETSQEKIVASDNNIAENCDGEEERSGQEAAAAAAAAAADEQKCV